MKSVIAALILMCAVIIGGGAYTEELMHISGELSEINASVRTQLNNENIQRANTDIERMREYLLKKSEILSAMGNHVDLDNIRMSMAELKEYTENGQIPDALAKSEVLEFLLEHLPENYRFKLKNIF